MRRGFAAIAAQLEQQQPFTAGDALQAAAKVLRRTMGGTSGPLWSPTPSRPAQLRPPRASPSRPAPHTSVNGASAAPTQGQPQQPSSSAPLPLPLGGRTNARA